MKNKINSVEKISEKPKENLEDQIEFPLLNMTNIYDYIKGFDGIRKYFLEDKEKYLMIFSERNQGNDIIKYLLNKTNRKYVELIPSKFDGDVKNERYYEEVLDYIKHIMKNDNILFLQDFDNTLYDIFSKKFTIIGNKKYLETKYKSDKIFAEVYNNFNVIIFENNNEKFDLFKDKFEKQIIKFKMFLEKKDLNIIEDILKYLDLISSLNNDRNLKIDLKHSLINCQRDDLEGLIFKIKNDMKIRDNSNKNSWVFKEGQEYENNILKLIFDKIVPLFCQDIMTSLILSSMKNKEPKFEKMKELIFEIYNNTHYDNFESYFNKINAKRSVIYTFSKEATNLFKENKIIENKFRKY